MTDRASNIRWGDFRRDIAKLVVTSDVHINETRTPPVPMSADVAADLWTLRYGNDYIVVMTILNDSAACLYMLQALCKAGRVKYTFVDAPQTMLCVALK